MNTTDRHNLEELVIAAVKNHLAKQESPRAKVDVETVVKETVSKKVSEEPESTKTSECVFSQTVITAEVLQSEINGHDSFQVGPKAVLTPSAHDYIREHHLTWTRGVAGKVEQQQSAKFLAAVVAAGRHVTRTVDELAGDWKLELQGNTRMAARTAVSVVSRGEASGVAVITGKPQAVVCLVNRSPKVRCAIVQSLADLNSAITEIGVNVIAVNPEQLGGFQLRQILSRFSEKAPQPPVSWESLSRLW